MKIGDLISVRDFPAVVQAHDIRALRNCAETDSVTLDDFVVGYLGFDDRSRDALNASLHSLFAQNGGAFFLNGVFGSGKSHLLGLLALLSDGLGHRAFGATHPQFGALLTTAVPCLVIHFSLDEYDAARWSLEAIVWRELEREWTRRHWPIEEIEIPREASRGEQFAALDEILRAHDLNGLALFIDELSLFLGAREHRALQSDAAFLQFLGQRARRAHDADGAGLGGLWIVGALQKTVEDIGGLEPYSLAQIRDRFRLLPLSLAHVPALIEHRLIVRRFDAAHELQRVCDESFEQASRALPRLDWGRDEWQKLYPFHPSTVALLEAVVSRFFSRTRSAALFCARAVDLQADAASRVLPADLFDYLAPEWETHPDLRALGGVWKSWQESLPDIADNATDARWVRALMQGLLLFKIAGTAPTVVQLANAVAFDAGLVGDANYDYARVLLERLRSRGGHLAHERHDGAGEDRYTVDAGARAGELARRAVQNALLSLPQHDPRIAAFALSCCRDEPLPLSNLQSPRTTEIIWHNAPRAISVALADASLSPQTLANRIAALGQAGHAEDALLLIAPPFGDIAALKTTWQNALQLVDDASARAGAIWWQPRPALRDEWHQVREATAAHGLESDPQLLDNRRGRAVLTHLRNENASHHGVIAALCARLLREGELISGAGLAIEAADLAAADRWTQKLESIIEWALPTRFDGWATIAPRARVLTAGNCEGLCLEILRRPLDAPFYAPSHERAVRAVAEPLGLALARGGRWEIASGRAELIADCKAIIGDGATLSTLEATLAKSRWGMRIEQAQMVLCALLRAGEIVAFDARGAALSAGQIGLPLRRAIQQLRPGARLNEAQWRNLSAVAEILQLKVPRERDFAAQEAARGALNQWRAEIAGELELATARVHQMRRQFAHSPAQWTRTGEILSAMESVINSIGDATSAFEMLSRAAELDVATLKTALVDWQFLLSCLEARHADLIAAHIFLTHPQLATPPDLAPSRQQLLARFEIGEAVVDDDLLPADFALWREQYDAIYRDWHNAQNAADRWATLRRISAGDELRALERLSRLTQRRFEGASELRGALSEEFDKQCARDGHLAHDPICASCHLCWGERVSLADPRGLQTIAERDFAALRALLRDEHFRPTLQRDSRLAEISSWAQKESDDTLFALLDDGALIALDDAFRPRRRVRRSPHVLLGKLLECRTKLEVAAAFSQWIDGDEALGDDDEIEWDND